VRLPLTQIYRAFPELDRFSDAACAGFVRQAVRRNRLSQVAHAALAFPVAALVLTAWWVLGRIGAEAMPVSSRFWDDGPGMAIAAVYCIAGPVSAILSVLLIRDRWLRRMIRRQITDTRCPACGYSMLGLAIVGGALTCPECGHRRRLADTGLKAADFLPEGAQAGASGPTA
jgi:hypothetical protein